MKYFIYLLQFFESFIILLMFLGGEYPEDVVVPFILLLILFVIFVALLKRNREHKKLVNSLLVINGLLLVGWFVFILYMGQGYFETNWGYFGAEEYRKMIIFMSLIIFMQAVKLFAVNKND